MLGTINHTCNKNVYQLQYLISDRQLQYTSYHIADDQSVHKLKVFNTINVPVLHELEVLLIHTPLDLGRHCLTEQLSLVSLLNKGLDRSENWVWSLHVHVIHTISHVNVQ